MPLRSARCISSTCSASAASAATMASGHDSAGFTPSKRLAFVRAAD